MNNRLRLRRILVPRMDAPFPLWMIFPVIFAALYASHFTLLRLPYYWDEAGYYIPAAWDFFRTGSLIPITTLSNCHPPAAQHLPGSLVEGCPASSLKSRAKAVLMVASLALLAVWRLAMRVGGSALVAFWTVALTAIYPIWFAQSSLAHADIFAAACTLWGLVYALPDRDRQPLARRCLVRCCRPLQGDGHCHPADAGRGRLCRRLPAAPGLAHQTMARGSLACGERASALRLVRISSRQNRLLLRQSRFLRYNAHATLDPVRILAAFGHRVLHLTAHMNLFVPVLMTFAALLLKPQLDADGHERPGSAGPSCTAFCCSCW